MLDMMLNTHLVKPLNIFEVITVGSENILDFISSIKYDVQAASWANNFNYGFIVFIKINSTLDRGIFLGQPFVLASLLNCGILRGVWCVENNRHSTTLKL